MYTHGVQLKNYEKEQSVDGDLNTSTVSQKKGKALVPSGILVMTLNCMWWWSSGPGALKSVEYPFFAINPKSTVS